MLSTDFTIPETQLPHLNNFEEDVTQNNLNTEFSHNSTQNNTQNTQFFEDIEPAKGIDEFIRIWMREHESPELLSYEEAAVNYMFSTIQQQRSIIATTPPGPDSFLLSNLLSLELRRLSYLVNSYLRLRLEKLVKQSAYYRSNEVEKQSVAENQFIRRFFENIEADLRTKFLDKLPAQLAVFPPTASELESGISFDEVGPNLEQHVVCRSRVNVNGFLIDDFGGTTDLEPGTILCLPYRFARELIRSKQVDLI